MRNWKIVETSLGHVILPTIDLRCPFCKEKLLLHRFVCFYQSSYDFKHADVDMKCPNCEYFVKFGVPISEEEYEILTKSKLHRIVLNKKIILEIAEIQQLEQEQQKEIERRLKALGYW